MAERKKKTTARRKTSARAGFTAEEKAAIKERAAEARAGRAAEGDEAVLAKIADMPEPDRTMARRLHALVTATAPELTPRLWYGMPAYAKDGKVVCFFQGAFRFKTRYATLGFNDSARLDDGTMWPTAYALTQLGEDEERRIATLLAKATS